MTLQTRDEAEIGATLFAGSDYAVLRLLGEGGMGVVYEAQHRPSGRLVALKVMHAGLARKPDVRQRFLREWSVACALSHPHLVAHLASGERAGRLYLALESLPDGDAEAWVERRTGLPAERDIARIGRDVARGLAELHARGVVHRDVKPSNIFLAEDGSAKLGDFGLARLMRGADAITADGMILGTPDFMAPEQALAEGSLDQRTDLYGLGATMYWLATRETPYDGATAWAIVHRVVSDPFPDPRRRRPDLSPAFAALILRACAKPPAERFQGAEAFADACQALIDGRVPEALAAAPAPLVSAEARRSGVRPLAIVVDDDPLIARLYRSRLEAEGFAVAVAATAQQALTALEAGPPALILLDLVLPDRDGIEVLRDLRRRTRAPVLVLSNAFNRERIHAAREAGADEVLAKSEATPAALAAAVRRLYGGAPEGAPQRPYAEAGAIDLRSATETPMRRLEALAALLEEEAPPGARDGALAELAATCRGVSAAASAVGRTGAASLAAAIELLARHLRDLPGDLTRSTTATIAAAVPVLHDLLSSTEAPRACQAARALVVDDDPLAVRLARLALERVGIAVSCAADAEAAIAELARGRFDLLVLDVVMPGKSGVEVAAAARRDRANRSAAIVFATSLADLRIPAAIAGGALDYIAKPFPAMELATKALTWIHHPARAERP